MELVSVQMEICWMRMAIAMKTVALLAAKNVQVHLPKFVPTVWMIIGQTLSMENVIAGGQLQKGQTQKEFAITAML